MPTFDVQKELIKAKTLINDKQFWALKNVTRNKYYDLDYYSKKFYNVEVNKLSRVQADELLDYFREVPTNIDRKRNQDKAEFYALTCGAPTLVLLVVLLLNAYENETYPE